MPSNFGVTQKIRAARAANPDMKGGSFLCPNCDAPAWVVDSRPTDSSGIRRRRHCHNGHRFTTYETTTIPTVDSKLNEKLRQAQGAALAFLEATVLCRNSRKLPNSSEKLP